MDLLPLSRALIGCCYKFFRIVAVRSHGCPFGKFRPEHGASEMSENRGIMRCADARHPVRAGNIRLRSVQVAAPASSRKSFLGHQLNIALRRALPRTVSRATRFGSGGEA
jgi:hypothetical protein